MKRGTPMKLLVLDGNSLVNRAFFGIKVLTTKDGRFTNAIYGFMNILLNLLRNHEPDEVAIAWDMKAPTFRHKMYDGYKATRHGMPPELAQQMPVLKELLTDLGFVSVSCEGWEADDILGTLAASCASRQDDCLLATGDRDSLQLVSETTTVLLATNRETVSMDSNAIREKYGVDPRQLIEVKSLMGDASDNIPGVAGIGEKTALMLIQNFGSLAGVYENISDPRIKPGMRSKLQAHRAEAELSRTLGTILCEAPIPTAPGTYARQPGNPAAAAKLLTELEIQTLIPRLGLTEIKASPRKELPVRAAESLPLSPEGEFYIALRPATTKKEGVHTVIDRPESWYAVQNGHVYPLETEYIPNLLDNPSVKLHVFDSAPLYAIAFTLGGEGASICEDGKLAAYLLNPSAKEYSVGALADSYAVSADYTCVEYPDAAVLEPLMICMNQKLDELNMRRLMDEIEFPLAQVLADMTHTGVLADKAGIEAFGKKLRSELESCLQRIYDAVGYEFNLNSPKQLGEALFDKLGLPPRKKNRSGYSTDAETLESLQNYSPVIQDILQYRLYQKLNSTYVEGLLKVIGPDGRIHSNFLQTEARTGRLSSTEPNLQNIPIRTELGSQMREFFISPPGYSLVDADYSQIELRLLAHISGDTAMREAFLAGYDIHQSTAAQMYHLPAEEITPAMRSSAKAINFGIMYGKGAFSLSKDLNISIKDAEAFLKSYLDAFPCVDSYMRSVISQAKEQGYVSTLFGRRRALPELSSTNFQVRSGGERMARNTPIQGTAADIIKLAMVRVWRRLRAEKLHSRLILTVHDELIVEAPEAEAPLAARILQEEMENCVNYSVPMSVEVKIGHNWLEAH